ncbi:cobalt-precorrin 5A hydrolase [Methylorubrum salsuginis]|uniref:Cobalt-precorrin 5A hydrolase n=1 Tax=Methylorubrum salsuginis TaxID=414703 RepID=A0A1I4ABK0_9HYPH|nr:cobalt-precorrin 5A hydrolase [Methylorubrum salsuginis]
MTGLVAGVGFRAATTPEEIVALVRRALHEAGLAPDALTALATAADRAGAPNFLDVAAALDLAPVGIEPTALAAADAQVVTRSARIAASRGVGSVAEAAALAAAGPGARLVLPRIASAGATCALARVPDQDGRR